MPVQSKIEFVVIGIATLLISLLVGFIVSILYLYRTKQQKHYRELEQIKLNYDKESFKAQLEMQEDIFQHISREIHDNVGQFLSLAKLHLTTFNFENKEKAIEKINNSSELLSHALDDLRDISKSLSSELIKDGGFDKAVQQQIVQLEKTGRFHVIFEIKGDYQYLAEQKEIILFRILQEAVNNIVRHSFASEIVIFLYCLNGSVKMLIQDNGKGFDPSIFEKTKKNIPGGIGNMRKRANLIDASFEIDSRPGNGTKILVTTPI